jgi:hypothetical protein
MVHPAPGQAARGRSRLAARRRDVPAGTWLPSSITDWPGRTGSHRHGGVHVITARVIASGRTTASSPPGERHRTELAHEPASLGLRRPADSVAAGRPGPPISLERPWTEIAQALLEGAHELRRDPWCGTASGTARPIWENGFIRSYGPRLEEAALNLIPSFRHAGPLTQPSPQRGEG